MLNKDPHVYLSRVVLVIFPWRSMTVQPKLEILAVEVLLFALQSMALPTSGRVIIETTVGEIDIELWAKVGAPYIF